MTDPLPDTTPLAAPDAAPDLKAQADKLVAEGKKAIALKSWEEGVEKYADALDLMRQIVGEFDPAMAPLLLSYGKALYELAFASQGVMGKEEVDKQAGGTAREEEPTASSSNFVFSADPTSDDEEVEGDEETTDAVTGAEAGEPSTGGAQATEQEQAEGEGEGEGEGAVDEPEDDYNAAWEVLDVARTIYSKIVDGLPEGEGREERLCLAECYLALGDVSLETENFPQAVQDYTSALSIKQSLLSSSSRALASVHYQLATVLEFTPNGRPLALSHVEHALGGFKERLDEISSGKFGEELAKMSEKERENENKDVEALIGDLEVKIEELKAAPVQGDLVSESINHLLGQGIGSSTAIKEDSGPVNDLTSMVKKKPKKAVVPPPAQVEGKGKGVENGEKRKAEEEEGTAESAAKKQKAE